MLVSQDQYGFSDARLQRDVSAAAIKAAEDMAKLMDKDPHKLTDGELAELNSALTKYGHDPLFAETLATSVGPKKTLQFYAAIADPGPAYGFPTPERVELAKQLQKNLGITWAPPRSPTARTCRSGRTTW